MKQRGILLQPGTVAYGEAWELQKALFDARVAGLIEDCFILLQHPPTFTYGRRYKEANLITNKDFYQGNGIAVYKTDRGGLATYHGPGQVVGYSIIKMGDYTKDYYHYLRMLEEVMLRTLLGFGIGAERRAGYTGVWVDNAKIGFIGVRLAQGFTMHGFSLNVNNDLSPFASITPCGIQGIRVTSMRELLGVAVDEEKVCEMAARYYAEVFQILLTPQDTTTLNYAHPVRP
ncbi:MAG: lipoyl(octanoyl) transferase LipB [Planctomycetota bacterium]